MKRFAIAFALKKRLTSYFCWRDLWTRAKEYKFKVKTIKDRRKRKRGFNSFYH